MRKLLLLTSMFFILSLCLMSISAFTTSQFVVDESKQIELNTETNYGTITLKDRYYMDVFGWFDKDLATLTLKENTDSCGNDCYAIKDIELFEEGSLVDDVRFYRIYEDGSQQLSSIRSYNVLIKTDEKVSIEDVYESVCEETGKILVNGTVEKICSDIKVGTKEVVVPEYIPYTLGEKKKAGNYTIKLVGEKRADWSYDWQVLSQGYWTTEWSVWGGGGGGFMTHAQAQTGTVAVGNEKHGVRVNMSSTNILRNVTVFAGTTATTAYVINATGTLATSTFVDKNASFNINLYAGQIYDIVVDSGGAGWTEGQKTSASYQYGTSLLTFNTSVYYNPGFNSVSSVILAVYGLDFVGGNSAVTLNSPANHFNSSSATITFNATANVVGGSTLKNISLYHNYTGTWVRNKTIAMGGSITTNTSIFPTTFASDKVFNWGIQACDSDNDCGWSENRTVTIDTTAPTINLLYPTGTISYGYVGQNISLNYSISDTNRQACWYNYNGTTNVTIPCTTNSSLILGTQKSIIMYANDSAGNLNQTSFSWDYNVFENSRTFNTTSYETATESFVLDATGVTSGNLIYNGTSYAGTIDGSTIYRTLQINETGNKSIYWSLNGGVVNTTINYQNVLPITFGLCNASNNYTYVNFTFKDESTDANVVASIPTSTFNYYLGDGSITRSLTYINNTANNNYPFCFTPSDRTLKTSISLSYKNTSSYPQRTYSSALSTFNNSTTQTVLYLLSTVDGVYETIQVLNSAEQPVSGATLVVTRVIGTTTTTVGEGVTGDDGTYTFWLNPDFQHTISASATGYTSSSQTFTPTGAGRTILLAGGSSATSYDFTQGITLLVQPNNKYLSNNTLYHFNFTLASTYWDVTNFGFILRNKTATLGSASALTNGGVVDTAVNTGTNTLLYMDYYWVITGNYSNGTVSWLVEDTSGTSWSIKHFFDNFVIYLNSGLFGLDDFGRALIGFIIIFVVVGIMSFKYGFNNPAIMSGIIFVLVMFFDVGIGWFTLDNKLWAVAHFPTILMALVLTGMIFKEMQK